MQVIHCSLEYKVTSELGEGAFWNYKTQELYWIDIEEKKLHIYNPENKNNRFLKTPSKIGTVVPIEERKALIALEDGMYVIDIVSGVVKLFLKLEDNLIANRLAQLNNCDDFCIM